MNLNPDLFNELDYAWLNLTTEEIKAIKPVHHFRKQNGEDDYALALLRILSNPDYLMYAAKIILNLDLYPEQAAAIHEVWTHPFPMLIGSRGFSKSSSMAFYILLKMFLTPPNKTGGAGVKAIITGAGFRQAKMVFAYMEDALANAPILRSVCNMDKAITRENDRLVIRVGKNTATCIPIGDGSKIRGFRGNLIFVDEFSSVHPHIFETVIQGFASVESNPVEMIKQKAKERKAKELGVAIPITERKENQIIISGSASYDFEHFSDYWKKYKTIIESKGDAQKLSHIFPDGPPKGFDYRDYAITRIPYDLIPEGFLSEKIIVRAKATLHTGTFGCEFGAVFSKDSQGFFKRSLISSCTASYENTQQPDWPKWCFAPFDARIIGDPKKKYIIAVDPASEVDKFAIVVVELHDNHARVVYCWTTDKKEHKKLEQAGMTHENDFYAFCARKIRQLKQAFPTEHIGIDAQGGGIAVIEALHNKNNIEEGESLFWPVSDNKNNYDYETGPKIIYPIQFANYEWTCEANNGLRTDMESKTLLFPQFDPVTIEIASIRDNQRILEAEKANPGMFVAGAFDTLEDVTMEIEELKNELTTITKSVTLGSAQRDRWDTPETKLQNGKKGRLRKDRYSALVIANMLARQIRVEKGVLVSDMGGLLMRAGNKEGKMYDHAPEDWAKGMEEFYKSL